MLSQIIKKANEEGSVNITVKDFVKSLEFAGFIVELSNNSRVTISNELIDDFSRNNTIKYCCRIKTY